MKEYSILFILSFFIAFLMTSCETGNTEAGSKDSGSVMINESDGTTLVTEDGIVDTYTIVLESEPSDTVTITANPDSQIDLGSGADTAITLLFRSSGWNVPQTVIVTAVDDSDVETSPHTAIIRHTSSSGDSKYNGLSIRSVNVDITDNDAGSDSTCSDEDVTNDIPFDYAIRSNHLAIHTPGGVLKTQIGPWGAHTGPHSGHPEGDKKANWSGFFATRYNELKELSGNGDGICQKGEICGLSADEIESRIPEYIAPDDNLNIWSVRAVGVVTAGDTYGSILQWNIDSNLCRYGYFFGHVGKISKDLRDKMVQAGYLDPWTVTGITDNLITGDPIILQKGESIGTPQILAQQVPGFPGYYSGSGAFPQTPWAQIEFSNLLSKNDREPFFFNDFYPLYGWLPIDKQDALRAVLYSDANNPNSFRYEFEGLVDWLWKAEMDLWTVNGFIYDFSNIYSRLGSWWENDPTGCAAGTSLCDEVFSIFPIVKTSPFYDSNLYDSAKVSYLVHHRQADKDRGPGYYKHFEWGEVINPATPKDVSGTMVIKWRIDHETITPIYQAISYHVFPEEQLLKIRWGSRVSKRSLVNTPPIPTASTVCDGVKVTCHSDKSWGW